METETARTIQLRARDGRSLGRTGRSGQFVGISVPIRGRRVRRSYSLSSCPELGEPLRITVQKVPGGEVSGHLVDHARPGDALVMDPPAGRFTLDASDRPILLLAAGSGITPIHALLRLALLSTSRQVALMHASRGPERAIFGRALSEAGNRFADRMTFWPHYDRGRRLGREDVRSFSTGLVGARAYACGPGGFMDMVAEAVSSCVHNVAHLSVESFGLPGAPAWEVEGAAPASAAPCLVNMRLDGREASFTWHGAGSVLDAALQAGVPMPHSCREGRCGACICKLVEGTVVNSEDASISKRDRERGLVLACQARPTCASLTLDFDY